MMPEAKLHDVFQGKERRKPQGECAVRAAWSSDPLSPLGSSMRARGSGDTECLTKYLLSLCGIRGLAELLGQHLGSVPEDTLRIFLWRRIPSGHQSGQAESGASPTPIRDEDFLVHLCLPCLGNGISGEPTPALDTRINYGFSIG